MRSIVSFSKGYKLGRLTCTPSGWRSRRATCSAWCSRTPGEICPRLPRFWVSTAPRCAPSSLLLGSTPTILRLKVKNEQHSGGEPQARGSAMALEHSQDRTSPTQSTGVFQSPPPSAAQRLLQELLDMSLILAE